MEKYPEIPSAASLQGGGFAAAIKKFFQKPRNIYIILFLLLLVLLFFLWYRRRHTKRVESFIQEPPFIVKRNQNIYDDFYSQIYDKIFHPEKDSTYIIKNVFEITQPSKKHSSILDIGCGTSTLLKDLMKLGYENVYGIDQSPDMIHRAVEKYPPLKNQLEVNNIETVMMDKNSFTHIFCIGFTIYEFKDKVAFLRNCYYWLKPNGYLFLHLVDRSKFDTIIPIGREGTNDDDSPQKYSEVRITETDVDFKDFKYTSSFDFSQEDVNLVVLYETFLDPASKKVRKNEKMMYMENIQDIIYNVQYCGFVIAGQYETPSKNEFIYILERPH